MVVALALARSGLRHRRGLLGLSLVLTLGIGAALASLEAARRTERAYPAYLRQSEVGELVVNPSFITARAEEIISSTPGVRTHASHSFLIATPDDGKPRTQSEVDSADSNAITLIASSDGRYVRQDRPVVHEGRMIRSGAEAFVTVETAEALELTVGDKLPLAFWAPSYQVPGVSDPSGLVEPLGRTSVELVGIGVFADEVLEDKLYPRRRVLVTPEVASRFDCTLNAPPPDDPRSLAELKDVVVPPGCALAYRYFSLRVDGGAAGARVVAKTLSDRFAEENENLPAALREADIGYLLIPSFTSEVRRDLDRSLEPAVRALQLFGGAAAATTIVVVLLAAFRMARRSEPDARSWFQLGATRAQRTAAILIPLMLAGAVGLAGSVAAGWGLSGIGPVASARSVEPDGRLGLSGPILLVVLAACGVCLAAGLSFAAAGAAKWRKPPTPAGSLRRPSPFARVGGPSLSVGLRAALLGSGAKTLLTASVAAVMAVLATVVFTTSLTSFAGSSKRFGWPYDAAVMVGFGYGGADEAAITKTLDRPEVQAWGMAFMAVDSSINGRPVPFVGARAHFNDLPLPVIEGVLPVADDEIALGALTADSLGLSVGDKAVLSTPYGKRQAAISGLVVLPSLGPFLADRVSLGTGALLSEQFVEKVLSDGERAGGMPPGALADAAKSLVGIDLRDGVDSGQFLKEIDSELVTWDVNGFRPIVYADPVRPAPVADVAAMRAVPVGLAGLFALAMVIALGVGITAATRARRRELAILRALGCLGRQLRASVRWHAVSVVGIGVVVGLPLGVALGRSTYQGFARGLGFFPEPVVSPWWTIGVVVAAFGMGLLASAGTARHAARTASAEALRHE
ncbi:MAG TPA: FtsX-like permease family protein [Acidimicrobiales bacterium]|nr:FtsX-like permease family protein [Acidimicrobiales bacterium]